MEESYVSWPRISPKKRYICGIYLKGGKKNPEFGASNSCSFVLRGKSGRYDRPEHDLHKMVNYHRVSSRLIETYAKQRVEILVMVCWQCRSAVKI
jgi:hypothetical protein